MKFSLFPSGKRLQKHFGYQRANKLCLEAIQMIAAYSKQKTSKIHWHINSNVFELFNNRSFPLKDYPVFILSESEIKFFLQSVYNYLKKQIKISLNNRVNSINRSRDIFEIITDHGTIWTKNLVIATGRAGISFLENSLTNLGLNYSHPRPSFGIRLEFEHKIAKNLPLRILSTA